MTKNILLKPHSVHLWRAFVPELLPQLDNLTLLLNSEEMARAERFKFVIHRQRYIVARAILRRILSLYLSELADEIVFRSGARGKPYLEHNPMNLQFNVSHSHELAVYALTLNAEIGVDVEKMEPDYNDGVAERFFSQREYQQLGQLDQHAKIPAFYQLWAGKEAIIKALGEGLYAVTHDFSLDLSQNPQQAVIMHQAQEHRFYVERFPVHPEYQAAFAVEQDVTNVTSWQWTPTGPSELHTPKR